MHPAAKFSDFDKRYDAVLMLELAKEAGYLPQHKLRRVLLFWAMPHFRLSLKHKGYRVHSSELEDDNNRGHFGREIERWTEFLNAGGMQATPGVARWPAE